MRFAVVSHLAWEMVPGDRDLREGEQEPLSIHLQISKRYFWSLLKSFRTSSEIFGKLPVMRKKLAGDNFSQPANSFPIRPQYEFGPVVIPSKC